jgi:hypothetical protein
MKAAGASPRLNPTPAWAEACPFDRSRLVFGVSGFEYGSLVRETGAYSNLSDVRERLGDLARAAGW